MQHAFQYPFPVLWMVHRNPSPFFHVLQSCAGVFKPAPVVPEAIAVGSCHPTECRNIVRQRAKTVLAFPYRLFDPLALGDVLIEHRNAAIAERVEPNLVEAFPWRIVVLELNRDTLTHGESALLLEVRAECGWEYIPERSPEQFRPLHVERLLGRRIHICESPVGINRKETIVDTLQDCGCSFLRSFRLRSQRPFVFRCFATKAAQCKVRADPGQQFTCGEWFYHVVVSTSFHAFDSCVFAGTGR